MLDGHNVVSIDFEVAKRDSSPLQLEQESNALNNSPTETSGRIECIYK